jgi:hypothetical protein
MVSTRVLARRFCDADSRRSRRKLAKLRQQEQQQEPAQGNRVRDEQRLRFAARVRAAALPFGVQGNP